MTSRAFDDPDETTRLLLARLNELLSGAKPTLVERAHLQELLQELRAPALRSACRPRRCPPSEGHCEATAVRRRRRPSV